MNQEKEAPRVPACFATSLRAGRMATGRALAEVARAAGIPSWRLGRFERGDEVPTPEEFGRLWEVLSS